MLIRLPSPEHLLTLARAYRPVPGPEGLAFASDLAGFPQVYRVDGPDRWPVRLVASGDRTLPAAETPLGLLVRQDFGGNETWQVGLVEPAGGLRRLTRDARAIHE